VLQVSVETTIAAPPQICFDLARDVEFHAESLADTQEKILRRPPNRLLALGDEVEFQGRHLGIRFRLAARITAVEPACFFQDQMVSGPFSSFTHDHRFDPIPQGTLMRDVLRFSAPLGPLGWAAERLFLHRHLRAVLDRRGQAIRLAAEAAHLHPRNPDDPAPVTP